MENEKGRDVQVCPNCLAEIFAKDYFRPDMWGSFSNFKCPKCGYVGLPIFVYEKDLEKVRKKSGKSEKQ